MFTLNCKGRLLIVDRPLVMGIINITPDSFYAGSRLSGTDAALSRAEAMLAEGAVAIDIGAQSTRPGAELLGVEEELDRVVAIIEAVHIRFPEAVLSVDTFHSRVAMECVNAGASIINDVSAGQIDDQMLATAAKLGTPYICMHMRGTPQTMKSLAHYDHLVGEILDFFIARLSLCSEAGIEDVIIDPGFGFSKNASQNFTLLKNLATFRMLGKPILTGLSRKSTIYKTLGITAAEALNGTTVMNTLALLNGANILRVHDVREAMECVKLLKEYN